MQVNGRQPWPGHRGPDGAPVHFERHRPEQTTLYRLVQQHAATFFEQAQAAASADLLQFIKDEFDAILGCGNLTHGFLRLRCGDCGHNKLVAFSCKRRGFCPSCGARRMRAPARWPQACSNARGSTLGGLAVATAPGDTFRSSQACAAPATIKAWSWVATRVAKAVAPHWPAVAIVPITAQGVRPPPAAPSTLPTPPVSCSLSVAAVAPALHSSRPSANAHVVDSAGVRGGCSGWAGRLGGMVDGDELGEVWPRCGSGPGRDIGCPVPAFLRRRGTLVMQIQVRCRMADNRSNPEDPPLLAGRGSSPA